MNLLKEICGTFCDGLAMREVPMGYAIKTPFRSPDGDAVALYVRRSKEAPGQVRLEDDGYTIAALQEEGVGLDNEQRLAEFRALLVEHGALYDEDEELIHTEYMDEEKAPAYFLKFMSLMLRISDLRLMSRDRARDTFKADVQAFVEEAFRDVATVDFDAPPLEVLSDYIPDAVVRTASQTLAIYAATGEVKALEALVLWQELMRQGLHSILPVVVLQAAKPPQIKGRTMSRIMNSRVVMASMDGNKWEVAQKLRQEAGLPMMH